MPIPKSDHEIVMDIPQWLLKKMVKVEPSPISGGDGEGVYYVGKFSDTWAPEDLRSKEFYYVHAKLFLSPSLPNINQGDPLFADYASWACAAFLREFCGPGGSSTTTWQNCLDPQFESSGTGCYPGTMSMFNYGSCLFGSSVYGPAMFIFSAAPSSDTDLTNLAAYSVPCPVASSTPALSGKSQTSGQVLLRAVGCDDSSNKVRYLRYTSEDRNSNSYTIAYLGIGSIAGQSSINIWLRYGLSSSVTKNATDYYYYIYTIGFQYQ